MRCMAFLVLALRRYLLEGGGRASLLFNELSVRGVNVRMEDVAWLLI